MARFIATIVVGALLSLLTLFHLRWKFEHWGQHVEPLIDDPLFTPGNVGPESALKEISRLGAPENGTRYLLGVGKADITGYDGFLP